MAKSESLLLFLLSGAKQHLPPFLPSLRQSPNLLPSSFQVELRTHQERQAHFAAEKQRLTDALAAAQASEAGLVRKLEALQTQLEAASESRNRASEAANAALNLKVETLLTRISDLERELRHVENGNQRHVADSAVSRVGRGMMRREGAILQGKGTSVESPAWEIDPLESESDACSEKTGGLTPRTMVKWPKPGHKTGLGWPESKTITLEGPKQTGRNAEAKFSFDGSEGKRRNDVSSREAPCGSDERLVQSDGEGPGGSDRLNRAHNERVALLEQEAQELRANLKEAREGQTVSPELLELKLWIPFET
jgi:hypothetical protein